MELITTLTIILYLAIIAVISHGTGYLLVNEEGFGGIFLKTRRLLGITEEVEEAIEEGDYGARDNLNTFAKMLLCDVCASVAIATLLGTILALTITFPETYPVLLKFCSPLLAISLTLLLKRI